MKVSGICVSVCLLLAIGRQAVANSHGGRQTETLGDVTFECREGWQIHKGNCYMYVDRPMTDRAALEQCNSVSADLWWGEVDYFDFVEDMVGPDTTIWTSLYKAAGGGTWRAHDEDVDLRKVPYWADFEPREGSDVNVKECTSRDARGLAIDSCDNMHNFVCMYPACLQGYMRCATEKKCVHREQDLCDGRTDCTDRSDEANCPDMCRHHVYVEGAVVDITSPPINMNMDCTYTFEAHIGETMLLSISSMSLVDNGGFLEVWSYDAVSGESSLERRLTGQVSGQSVYSTTNILQLRLYRNALAGPSISAQTFRATTVIPELSEEVIEVRASRNYASLDIPFSGATYRPDTFMQQWSVTALNNREVISFNLVSTDPSRPLENIPFSYVDGELMYDSTYTPMVANTYYTTGTSRLWVKLMVDSTMDTHMYVQFKLGCTLAIQASDGIIQSPGLSLGAIPNDLTCRWTLNAGQLMNPDRGMTIKFSQIDLADDLRSADYIDVLEVFTDGDTAPETGPVVGNIISAPTGQITVDFSSDSYLQSAGFSAYFGTDCAQFSLSAATVISPLTTHSRETVRLSCPMGYEFCRDRYSSFSELDIECYRDVWYDSNWDAVIVPECQIKRCGIPQPISNGYILNSTNVEYGATATYKCNTGFTMNGLADVDCDQFGEWGIRPTCNSESCDVLQATVIPNGGFEIEEGNDFLADGSNRVDFDTVVRFVCDEGYELIGQPISHCDRSTVTGWTHGTTLPACTKLKCPLPALENAGYNGGITEVEFQGVKTVTCDPGYHMVRDDVGFDTSVTLNCQANQTFDKTVTCVDMDECDLNSFNCIGSECRNTIGSYECDCWQGYQSVNPNFCSDIDECLDAAACFHQCADSPAGSFTCTCNAGFELFTDDGKHGFYINNPGSSQMVKDFGDHLKINYTCVPMSCPVLESPANGIYLTAFDNRLFHSGDVVTLQCNDGYKIDGSSLTAFDTTCLNGAWTSSPSCIAKTCNVPFNTPGAGEYNTGDSLIEFGETLTLNCTLAEGMFVERRAKCVVQGAGVALAGDNINECPVIDCGDPNLVSPQGASFFSPQSTRHWNVDSSFTFDCGAGYDDVGAGEDSIDNRRVTCKANGNWAFGTLSCDGKKCPDPGTPGDASQVVRSYEIGEELAYTCDRAGFKALHGGVGVERNFTCQLVNNAAVWSNGLSNANLPVCTDVTPPEIFNCPTSPLLYYPMESLNLPTLSAFDNAGELEYFRSDSTWESGDRITSSQTITYTALDFQQLSSTCVVEVRVIDVDNDGPSLTCPDFIEIIVQEGVTSIDILPTYNGQIFSSGTNLVVSPSTVSVGINKIGQSDRIAVTATNDLGLTKSCNFLVTYPGLDYCDERVIYPDPNRNTLTFTDDGNEGLTAMGTCRTGYTFRDGSPTKEFTCTPGFLNGWVYDAEDVFCLAYQNPSYDFSLNVQFEIGTYAPQCHDAFDTLLASNLGTFESNVQGSPSLLPDCASTSWDITGDRVNSNFNTITTTLLFSLSNLNVPNNERTLCRQQIIDNYDQVFSILNGRINCPAERVSITPFGVAEDTLPALSCGAASYDLVTSQDYGSICIPCGPGSFYDETAGSCSQCPIDSYSTMSDRFACVNCPDGADATAVRIECQGTCPNGYFSLTGMFPCAPCPEDSYWVDSKTCLSCPSAGSTLGQEGATTQAACRDPCGPGTFSRTGYAPCAGCGNAFFTSLSGQKACSECEGDETTFDSSITNPSQCVPIPAAPSDHTMMNVTQTQVGVDADAVQVNSGVADLEACMDWCLANPDCQELSYQETGSVKVCFQHTTGVSLQPKTTDIGIHMRRESNLVCDRSDCSNNGNCALVHHRPHCTCDAGYKGELCQTFISICDSEPCLNGGECMENGPFKDYTCTCPNDPSKYVMRTLDGATRMGAVAEVLDPGGFSTVSNQGQCENACLDNDLCEFAAFVQQSGGLACYLFGANPTLSLPPATITLSAFMEKDRRPGQPVGGDNCGEDLLDACDFSQCNEKAMCMDLVEGYQCLCPVSGGLQGTYCDDTSDPCSSNPCMHGSCQSFGAVRYECTCQPGYSGINCDNDIDECMQHPDACANLGTCINLVNDYSCTCSNLFFGDNCENVPNFCTSISCLGDNVCSSSVTVGHTCHCDTRYFTQDADRFCEQTSDPCQANACRNGSCVATGWDTYDYRCECEPGFVGALCQTSIDDCPGVNCNNGRCIDEHQGFRCECDMGFEGDSCMDNIDDCDQDPCDPDHGSCEDLIAGYRCNCEPGFTGELCSVDIDECLSYPCQHGGVCTQGDDSYSCDCPEGWTGTNCEQEVNTCTPGLCNSGKCYSLLDGPVCICGGGTEGTNCEERRLVCNTLSHFTVCANSGFCRDFEDTARCDCPKVYNPEDCYFEDPLEDTQSFSDGNVLYFSPRLETLESCQRRCRELEECGGLTYTATSRCALHRPENIDLQPSGGGDSFYTRICPSHYSGLSCEYKKDWCSAENNPCGNGAECVEHALGYTCNCRDGYVGAQCDNYVDPCDSNPCGNSPLVTCSSSGTEAICQCQQGQVLSGNMCTTSGPFVVLVDNVDGMAARPSLNTPFSFSSSEFSIMLWLKVHQYQTGVKLFTLKGTQTLNPDVNDPMFQLEVQEQGIVVDYNGQTSVLLFGPPQFFEATLYNGEWHFFGISINSDGAMFCSIDSTASTETVRVGSALDLQDLNMNIWLGDYVRAEYEDLEVYDVYLSASDFTLARAGSLNQPTPPRQGWWNWHLPQYSYRMTDRLLDTYDADDSKVSPVLDCSAAGFQGSWSVVAEHKFFSRSDVLGFTNSYQSLDNSNPALHFTHSIPSVMEWGMYSAIAIGMNEQTERYGECRAKIYGRYNDVCPDFVRHDQSVIVTPCSANSGICDVACNNAANSLSAPFPFVSACGSLGVYNQRDPWHTAVVPTCTTSATPKYVVTVKQEYEFSVVCDTGVDNLGTAEARLRTKLETANTDWPGICVGITGQSATTCSNFMFGYANCTSDTSMMMEVEFSASFSASTLSHSSAGITLALRDVFLSLILEEGALVLSNLASAMLLPEVVEVEVVEGCGTGNTLLYDDDGLTKICAPCGRGHYVDSATMRCMRCAPGSHQDETNMYECKPCGEDTTNYEYGEVSVTSCVEICSPGTFRKDGSCDNCIRHSYQAMAAKTYCDYCDLGFKTASVGSDSVEQCNADCPAGEFQTTNSLCEVCPRGQWRSQDLDDCQLCPTDTTTLDDGSRAETEDDCAMDICNLGQFWNMTSQACEDCDFGSYQDELYALECKPCHGNLTTKFQKSTSEDTCTFYCAAGYEVEDSTAGTCRACYRGSYKMNDGMASFEACVQCSVNTTDDIAQTSAADCFVPICQAGQYILNGACEPCPLDTYSEVDMPYTSTMCELCSCDVCDTFGTMQTGTNNETLCQRYCEPGMELVDDECVMCKRGFYKDNAGNTRFDACKPCSADGMTITDDVGADSFDLCVIPKCDSGQYIFETATGTYECRNCSLDQYQEVGLPQLHHECIDCPPLGNVQQGTEIDGAWTIDACKPMCPGGRQYDETTQACVPCPIGQFKVPSLRFGMCVDCMNDLYVTSDVGADSNDLCDLRDCGPGTYIAANGVDCLNCSLCSWQDQRRMTECIPCGDDLCTRTTQAKAESECTISCGPGKEGTEVCVDCPDGTFKLEAGFGDCVPCQQGYTSSPSNRTHCNLRNCWYGTEYTVDANGVEDCVACPVGEIKDAVGNDVMCSPCDASYTTDGTGQRECALRDCLPGTTLDGEECVDCAVGFYKSDQGNMSCTPCPENTTTDGAGKMAEDQCNLAICPIGRFRSQGLDCLPCQVNEYNPNVGETACVPCDDGKITLQEGANALDQCVPLCVRGLEYNEVTKLCDQCPVGYYKNSVGNTIRCTECPERTTTVGKGTESRAGCDQTVCPPGTKTTRTDTQIVCQDCEIGTYNPNIGQETCLPCPGSKTTFRTARTDESDCFEICGKGRGFKSQQCTDCVEGEYNDAFPGNRPNECKMCPPGLTSLTKMATSCGYEDTRPIPVVTVTITVVVRYKLNLASCSPNLIELAMPSIFDLLKIVFEREKNNNFQGNGRFCNQGCGNMGLNRNDNLSCSRRRKKREVFDVVFNLSFFNVSSTIEDTGSGGALVSTNDAIEEILLHNEDNILPDVIANDNGSYVGYETPVVSEICAAGQVSVADSCTPCAVGEYWETGACVRCPIDTYQDETGQLSCKDCPLDTFHDLQRQTSASVCQSYCVTSNYCNGRGVCTSTGRRTASCSCYEDYEGARCEGKKEPSSDMDLILGLAIGGGGGLLLLILLIVGIYKYLNSQDNKERKKRYHRHDPEYTDNIYDNYSQSRGLAPIQSIGYPALGYRPDPSVMDDAPYAAVYKNPAYGDPNKSQNEETFVWQA